MERSEVTAHIWPVSMAIREYLHRKGEASPSEFYQMYKPFKESISYSSVARYFWILKKIGLIKIVGHKKARYARIPKTLYSVVPERLGDKLWLHPQRIYLSYRKRSGL